MVDCLQHVAYYCSHNREVHIAEKALSERAHLGILVVVVVMVVVVRVVLLLLMVAVTAATSVDDAAPVQPRVPRAGLLVPAAAATDTVHATAAVEPLPA